MSSVNQISTLPTPLTGNFNGQNINLRPISVEEYDFMIKNGFLDENDQVELLNGAIAEKIPKGPKHSSVTNRIAKNFFKIFDEIATVRV